MYCGTISQTLSSVRWWRVLLASSALLLVASLPARAQSPATDPLSLQTALAIAREKNADLQTARSALEAARAQEQVAAALINPVLSWTTQKINVDGTPASTIYGNGLFERNYDTIVSVGQPIELGGKRKNRRRSAEEAIAGALARVTDSERLLAAAVVKAYTAAVVAGANAALVKESADAFEKTAELAAVRERAGDISASERAQIEIASGRSRADVALAEVAFRNAVRSLEALLGIPALEGRVPADGLESLLAATSSLSADGLGDEEVLSRRPDLLALEAAIRKAQADLALARAFRVPDPTLLAQYERQPPDQRNTVGVGVSLPLPIVNRNAGGIRAAEVALSASRRDLELARLRARAELAASRAAVAASSSRSDRYEKDLLPKAEGVRRTVEYAYSHGAASLLELLEAERNANEIRLAAAAARGDLLNARADLAAAGMLPLEIGGAR